MQPYFMCTYVHNTLHRDCVGLRTEPAGDWLCDQCSTTSLFLNDPPNEDLDISNTSTHYTTIYIYILHYTFVDTQMHDLLPLVPLERKRPCDVSFCPKVVIPMKKRRQSTLDMHGRNNKIVSCV